jgi:hypothetical protein
LQSLFLIYLLEQVAFDWSWRLTTHSYQVVVSSITTPTHIRRDFEKRLYNMAPSPYPYKPLSLPEETRILTVLPGSLDDPLVCTLTHIPIADASAPYVALSYCWNSSLSTAPPEDKFEIPATAFGNVSAEDESSWQDIFYFQGRMMTSHLNRHDSLYYSVGWPLPPATILCDGVEVTVGGELLAALRRLRDHRGGEAGEGLRIWVDALCINQGDVAEKNVHVGLMGSIYAGADMVHVWFGESVGNEEHVFEALNIVHEVFDDMLDYFAAGTQNMGRFQYKFINDERIRRLDAGALNEWLSRSWVRTPLPTYRDNGATHWLTRSMGNTV